MSNHLAIATATAALQRALHDAAVVDVPGVRVSTERPRGDNRDGTPEINVYLYQVTPNAALRNGYLPTRNGHGELRARPGAALDLHYLISFYGDETRLEPQRLLGSAVRALHAQPLLRRDLLRDVVQDASLALGGSDLPEARERVRVTMAELSLEELSKLWSVMVQVPYTLSVPYVGSVVVVEPDLVPPTALPVRERGLYVVALRRPTVHSVQAAGGADAPIEVDSTLVIRGIDLAGEITDVHVGDARAQLSAAEVSDQLLTLPFAALDPPDSLRAGVRTLQIVHRIEMGDPKVPHDGVESSLVPFALSPRFTLPASASGTLALTVEPVVGKAQRAVVLLIERGATAPRSYSLRVPARELDATSISVSLDGVAPGTYLVQLQIDGVSSRLQQTGGEYSGPSVTVT